MDHFVVDSTPKGSAILAYGRARGPRWNGKLLALIAGSFAVIGVLVYGLMNTRLTLPLPADRLILVAIKPKQAFPRLSTELRQALPPTWRAALETRSSFPAILGVSLDEEDRLHAFALVLRTNVVVPTEKVRVADAGVYRLLTDGSATATEPEPLSSVWKLTRRLRRHDLSFVASGRLLSRLALSESGDNDDVTGVWDGTRGTMNVAPSEDGGGATFDAPIFSRLGDNREDALPVVEALASQGIALHAMSAFPNVVSVRPDNEGGAILAWRDALATDDLVTIRTALGITDRAVLTLPDTTDVIELLPSSATATMPMATSTWSLSGATLQTSDWIPQEARPDPSCTGHVRFLLQEQALRNVLTAWDVPISWQNAMHRIQIVHANGIVSVCLN